METPPPIVTAPPPAIRRRHRAAAIILLIIIAAVIAGLVYWQWPGSSSPYAYKYASLSDTTVSAAGTGAGGISFKKPPEFKPTAAGSAPFQLYEQTQTAGGKAVVSSYLLTASAPVTPADVSNLDTFNNDLTKSPGTQDYKTAAAPITSFVDTTFSRTYSVRTLTNAAPFRNAQVKGNAWQFDLSVSGASNGAPDLEGRAVYAWTSQAAYFYILAVPSANWQSDQSTWQTMLASISLQ